MSAPAAASHDAASEEERIGRSKGRLIIVQGGFPCLSATFILDQITGLIDRGWDIENWSPYDTKEATPQEAIREYDLLKKTRYLRFPKGPQASDTDQWVKMFCELNSLGSLENVAAFHVHYGPNFNLLAPLFRFLKTFVVVSFHGYDASLVFKKQGDSCYAYLFERTDLITTPTQHMKDELVRRGCPSEKVRIHRYGVDLDKFAPPVTKQPNGKPTLLTVARLVEKKGIEFSLRALAEFKDRVAAEYRIIGDGPLRASLEELARNLGIHDRVSFLGAGTKQDVQREMARADVFVLSSVTASDGDQEGLPVSLIEAQAMGLPVVSTHHAGIPELVVDGVTGLLVREKDVAGLARGLEALVSDPQLRQRFSTNALERVCREFDIERWNDKLSDVFLDAETVCEHLEVPKETEAVTSGFLDDMKRRESSAPAGWADALAQKDNRVEAAPQKAVATRDIKGDAEFAYWKIQKKREGTLGNRHYEYFYTTHFGLSREVFTGKRILDIGCGPRGSLEWADMTAERVGLDPLAARYRELGANQHKMRYVAAPSEAIPFPDGHFDVVTSFNSLDHVADLDQTIREIVRVVKPGGLFLLLTDVNHSPTPCEPMEFSWDVVKRFEPHFDLVEQSRFEKPENGGLYQGVKQAVAYDLADTCKRLGILSAKFRKRASVSVPASPIVPSHATPANFAASNQQAFGHLQHGFDLLKERRFADAQAECRAYQKLINYDALPQTDNRAEKSLKVSVVIVAYKIGRGLIQCLDSLAASENPPHEIIVVDNGGNEDISDELARRPILHIRVRFNVILAEGRNIGVHFARAPIVSFLDDDAIAATGYLAAVVEAFETFEIHAFRGKVLPRSGHANNSHARHYDVGNMPIPADIDTEGNSAFRADSWRKFGGQDPLLFGSEGAELSYRMAKELGDTSLIYWPFAVIHHDYAVTDTKLEAKQSRGVLMREYSVFKHANLFTFHDRMLGFAGSNESKADGNRLLRRRAKTPSSESAKDKSPLNSGTRDPFVSICVPTYNRAPFIEKALESALAQTYRNFEVVVVDDGSTDNTATVMARILDPRVRFVVKEHSGGPATRNRCIAEAHGEFLLWLDSDDALLPNTLELYAAAMGQHPDVDVFYGNLLVADEQLTVRERWNYSDYLGWRDALFSDMVIENRIPNVAALVRKSCYDKVGGYNPAFPRAHDYEFWLRLAPVATMKSVHAFTGIYRRHEESLSKLGKPADTSFEANAVKAVLAKHELSSLLPFCYVAGAPSQNGNVRAWLIASLIMVKYGDLAAALEFAKRSVSCVELKQNMDILDILEMAVSGRRSRPAAKTEPLDEFHKFVAVAKEQFAAGQVRQCAQACAQLTELRPEAAETLLLVGLSLRRWGKPQEAKAAFRCLVKRQCEEAHLQAVTEAEALRRTRPETATDSASVAERLATLLSPFFGVEPIPSPAIESTLFFVATASATDARKFLETHREKQTPLFFAMLGLTADEIGPCVGAAVAEQIARLRGALQPSTPTVQQRPQGYSFCIITGGQRRAVLERQITSIRALGLPDFEILVGGDVSNVPDGVAKVDMADAARAGRLGKMRNTLAQRAKFNHLIISDDDIVFDKDFGAGLKRFGEGYDAMAVRIVNPDGSRFWDWAATGGTKGSVLLDYWDADPNVYITGGICVLKADVLDRVAWDDLRGFYECEDVDFSARLKAAGIAICFNAFCKVLHDDDRYSRVDRRIFRFDHLLNHVLQRYQARERDEARRFLTEAQRMVGTYPDRIAALKEVSARIGEQNCPVQLIVKATPPTRSSAAESSKSKPGSGKVKINWIGSFLDHGSLSHVNREMTNALELNSDFDLQRVSDKPAAVNSTAIEWQTLARKVATNAPMDAAVTVRHAWPPDWKRPRLGKLAVIQPWEFGALPEVWVRLARDVDEFWVPSQYVRNVYIESGVAADKVVVVPNGVNPSRFHPQVAPMKLATQKKLKFLFVGGTIFRKGPDVLLKAYLESFTAADDVCLVIKDFGGQSVYAGQTFEQQIRAAQLQPSAPEILYLNENLSPESLPGLYTACDCFVLPYRGEGFGLPVLEAMACGLPVIVTAGGATDDFAREGFAYRIPATRKFIGDSVSDMKLVRTGWLLEPDAPALAARMKWVVEHCDDARATGLRASDYVRREWTWEHATQIADGRVFELQARSETVAKVTTGKSPERKNIAIVLPPCAPVGHVGPARELLSRKKPRDAWQATLAALKARPFHPEAYLLLAEISQAVGDCSSARRCAEHARRLAPGWKPARRFLNQRLKGNGHTDWLVLPDVVANPQSPSANRLSVCLITKNEEKFIARCLASVRGFADQIVVVDTGSTDRTIEIAKEHGAEVHSFAWCEDFSAARNAALEHVRGDWVLVLDADEELTSEGREVLRQEMCAGNVIGYRLPIVDVGNEEEGHSYVPRLFRNAPGLFYVGRIHEQVFSSVEVRREEWGLDSRLSKATLLHYGYTEQVTQERDKNARNLRLLELAIKEMPNEPNLLMNYGLELARGGRSDIALDQYRKAFRALQALPEDQVVPELRESLLTQLCTQLMAAKQHAELVQMQDTPLVQRGGPTASLHFGLGLAYMELKDFRKAADQFRQCIGKRDQPSLTPMNRDIRKAGPHHCLAVCLTHLGEFEAAMEAFQQALKADPQSRRVRFDFAAFLASRGLPLDALKQLHALVSEKADEPSVWLLGGQIALSQPQFVEFACDWTGEAMKLFPQDPQIREHRAEAWLLSGNAREALALWKETVGPRSVAGLLICEAVTGHAIQPVHDEEAAVSREFLNWYRRLVHWGANEIILKLNENVHVLRNTLPTAVTTLETAFSEVREPAVV